MRIILTSPLHDKRIPVEIEPSDTIDEVKAKAKASDPKLKFAFDGKIIGGGPVSDYGVQEDSELRQATLIFLQAEQREEFYVDLEWTVSQAKTLARARFDLDSDADINLYLGATPLSSDSTSLREAGVAAGKMLRLVSQALAEEHARRCKVYRTGLTDALRDGVAMLPDSQEPFALDCPLAELAELGPGWPLSFELGVFLAIVCAVLFVLHIPIVCIYASGTSMQLWPASSSSRMEPWLLISVGNLGPDGSDSRILGWTAHISCLVLLLAGTYYGRRQHMLKTLYDDLEVEPMDYAILLHGMPGQALDFWSSEERVRKFVEGCLGPEKRVEVVQVVLGYDVPRLKALIKDFQTLAQHADDAADSAAPLLLSTSFSKEDIQKVLTTPELLLKELPCHACCVVVLRSPDDLKSVLKRWATTWEQVLWCARGACSVAKSQGLLGEELHFSEHSRLPQVDDRHPISIRRARAPSDLQWENFGATYADCFSARLKTHGWMGVIFLVGFVVILVVETVAGGREGGAMWQVLLRCGTLVVVNIAASSLAKRLSARELHLTRTDQDDSLMVKLAIFMCFNYTFLLIALYRDPGTTWYRSGGLLATVCVLMPTDTVVMFLIAYYGISSRLAQYIKSQTSPDPGSTPDMTQAKLNRIAEPTEMNISRPLAHLIKSFLMCMFFLPFWPLGSLWMVASLVLKTCGYKKQLLRDSKRPYRQSHVIAFSALNFVYVGGLVYSFSAWWFMTPSLKGGGEDALTTFTPFLAMASFYFLVAPRKLNNSFAGLFAPLVDGVLELFGINTGSKDGIDVNTHNYYDVQHHWDRSQKYHTANPAYVQLGQAMLAQKVRPPWDPKTGDLPDPGAA